MKVVELKQTCDWCPSQWEGYTEDKRPVYIRYRWGELSVNVGLPGQSMDDAIDSKAFISISHGNNLSGLLMYEKLKELVKDKMELP